MQSLYSVNGLSFEVCSVLYFIAFIILFSCYPQLGRLRDFHPLPGLVLQHRLLNKLKTTYVDGILACLHGSSVRAAW